MLSEAGESKIKDKKTQNNMNLKDSQKGVAIYLAIVIMAVILSIGVGLSAILIDQIRVFQRIGDSVVAIYAADTGIERALYENNKIAPILPGGLLSCAPSSCFLDLNNNGQDATDPTYTVQVVGPGSGTCPATATKCFNSTGIYKGVQRKIEASL